MRHALKGIICIYALSGISGCAYLPPFLDHIDPAQSWDQENLLNLSDKNCPAQYDAPNGDLRQCIPDR